MILPPEQQLGVVLALQVLVDEVSQQLLQHVGGVLQFALQHRHDERGHIAAIAHGKAALRLQRADEGQQEHLVVDELSKELQAFLHTLLPVARDLRGRPRGAGVLIASHNGVRQAERQGCPRGWLCTVWSLPTPIHSRQATWLMPPSLYLEPGTILGAYLTHVTAHEPGHCLQRQGERHR